MRMTLLSHTLFLTLSFTYKQTIVTLRENLNDSTLSSISLSHTLFLTHTHTHTHTKVALRENINDTDCDLFLKVLMRVYMSVCVCVCVYISVHVCAYHHEMSGIENALALEVRVCVCAHVRGFLRTDCDVFLKVP